MYSVHGLLVNRPLCIIFYNVNEHTVSTYNKHNSITVSINTRCESSILRFLLYAVLGAIA